ncbi:MAG: cytochrome c oxidase assembly protein subunit 15 [Verrucomicrobiales bacterium]|jgi:cytochrome c oxidase assembly protein subunit 15
MRPRLEPFQRIAVAALFSVILLIFVGAFVRATGAGLGCPDWPTCWGCYIPPTSIDQVDFERLDIERFKKHAARHGENPDNITEESLRKQFNPVHVWTEYINRLTSLPVGLFSIMVAGMGIQQWRRKRPWVFVSGITALFVVLINAWLGMKVVLSGLKPGIITLHMALAIFLLGLLVYIAWRGCERPWRLPLTGKDKRILRILILALLAFTIFEGLIGSQVREMTDQLARSHVDMPRQSWTQELEATWVYLIHRSFSWVIFGCAMAFYLTARNALPQGCRWLEKAILGFVIGQMILGIILSQIGILAAAQVLHIGLSSLLISAIALWILGAFAREDHATPA